MISDESYYKSFFGPLGIPIPITCFLMAPFCFIMGLFNVDANYYLLIFLSLAIYLPSVYYFRNHAKYQLNFLDGGSVFSSHDIEINRPWRGLKSIVSPWEPRVVEGYFNDKHVMIKSYHEERNVFYYEGLEFSEDETFELTGTYPIYIYLAQLKNLREIKEEKIKRDKKEKDLILDLKINGKQEF